MYTLFASKAAPGANKMVATEHPDASGAHPD